MGLYRINLQEVWSVFMACYSATQKNATRKEAPLFITVSVCDGREISFYKAHLEKEILQIKNVFKKIPKKFISNSFSLSQLGVHLEGGEIGAEMLLALGVATRMIAFSSSHKKFHATKKFFLCDNT